MVEYKSRNDVPLKYKWDLTSFFKNEDEFNKVFDDTKNNIDRLSIYVGCTKDADKLYEYLELDTNTTALWEDLYVYAYLINDQELGISESIDRKNKTDKLFTNLLNNNSFFDPELLKLDKDSYLDLFNKNTKLLEYKSMLDRIYRNKEHILDEEKEKLVNSLVQATNHYEDIYANLKNSEIDYGSIKIDGNKVKIAVTNYRKLMKNDDENIRKKVYKSFNTELEKYEGTFAMLLNTYVSLTEKLANINNHKSSWTEKLFSYNISDKVYKTLTSSVLNNLEPINRYFELKKNVLGKDKLNMYDLSLDMGSNNKKYTIEEAQELCLNAVKPLGEDYVSRFKKIFDNHYIDYCQYHGKESGAYSFSTYTNHSRILMSFNDDLDSVSTIIHEGGHNVNHQYIIDFNPIQYRENTSMVAEVTSLTNECLLSHYLMEHGTTKEEKLSGIENIMRVIVSNLYGSVREGKLEQDMHKIVEKGGTISKEFMSKETKKYLKKFYGNAVKMDKHASNSWILRSHYYMNYYLYSYAISISVATSISKKIIDGDKDTLNNYIEFLKCGSDKWPSEAFNILGVNIEEADVYNDACNYLNSLVDKYIEILKEGE